MATLSPASAKARAMARPMPRLPPVTRTERLKRSPFPFPVRPAFDTKLSVTGPLRGIEHGQAHAPVTVGSPQNHDGTPRIGGARRPCRTGAGAPRHDGRLAM